MLLDKENTAGQLAQTLGIAPVEPSEIVQELEKLNYQSQGSRNKTYHATNLYHRDHITDGRHGSWESILNKRLVNDIEKRHRGWFKQYGYLFGK